MRKINSKGITLISLVITIAVLLILASIATYSGIDVIRQSKLNKFTAEMKVMQTQVNDLYQKYTDGRSVTIGGSTYTGDDILNKIGQDLPSNADSVFTSEKSGITEKEGYRYYNQDTIKGLNIDGVEGEFYVNVKNRSVISTEGLEYEGTTYYTLEQLPNGLYNVDYEDKNTGKPTFDVSIENIGDKNRIVISNINYNGYVDKWQVKYQKEGQDYWSTSEDLSFVVSEDGLYKVKIVNGNIESDEKKVMISDGRWNGSVNIPNLKGDMEPVYWDESNNEVNLEDDNFDSTKWYDYNSNKWANAKTSDGSYWVWIPRYEYQVINNVTDSSQAGTVNVNFIPTSTTEASSSDYYIHPAFRNDSSNNFSNGGWDSELPGFWVAKYEMSMEDGNGNHVETTESNGNVALSDTVKMVSKPGVTSWRYINIANSYTNSYNYDRTKESHLMKNSEWGAVAFLTHSKYGRKGQEVTINSNSSYYTGGGTGEAYKTTNTNQSSTGNITGIYDLSGGAYERVAAFNSSYSGQYFTGSSYVDAKGNHFASTGGKSTKYATAYSNSTGSNGNDFTVGTVSIRGDAIQEAYVSNHEGWFNDGSYFVDSSYPFFGRGGDYNISSTAGAFCSSSSSGSALSYYSFHVVLV